MPQFYADLYALDNPPQEGGAADATHPSGPFPTREAAARAGRDVGSLTGGGRDGAGAALRFCSRDVAFVRE